MESVVMWQMSCECLDICEGNELTFLRMASAECFRKAS